MTWSLRLVRSEVAGQLSAAAIPAVGFLPARLDPPVVLIAAGDPYLEMPGPEPTFANLKASQVRLELTLVAGIGDNETSQNALDDLICETLMAVSNWNIERVTQPFQLEANGALYLSSRVIMTGALKIEEVI